MSDNTIDIRDKFDDEIRALNSVARIMQGLAAGAPHGLLIGADELDYLAARIEQHCDATGEAFEKIRELLPEAQQ